ncbi:hypothetical protein BH23DEI1_BH23DEI1_13760 [soil metagenome]
MTTKATTWRPDLHHRLARRYTFDVRATRGAAGALAASLAGWAVGLDLAPHGVLMLVAAVVGAALPARAPIERAFGWIGRESGLAYQTHVEHDGRSDPYGFLAEAALQARLTVRAVAAPPRNPWWLPVAAVAVGIWLIAAVVGGLPSLTGLGTTPAGVGGTPESAPPPVSAPVPGDPDASDPLAEEAAVEEEPDGDASTPPDDEGDDEGERRDDGAGDASEGETVERFLDNLRERPGDAAERAPEAERDAARDGVRDDDRAASAPEPGERDPSGDFDAQLRPTPADPEGDEESSETEIPGGGDTDPDGEPGEDGEAGTEADPEGENGDGSEEGAEEVGDADAEGDEGEPTPAEDGQRPDGGPGGEEPFDAGAGDDAGVGRGAPGDAETEELEAAGESEPLPGLLLPGEETPGGRVRLPGRDDGHLPEGRITERYERAVEQAVTDGTVPVPYQEIIRNYFR